MVRRVFADREGNVYILIQGEVSPRTPLPDWDKESKFYINYINNEYVEYDSVEITKADLEKFQNHEAEVSDAESYIMDLYKPESDDVTIKTLTQMDYLYSGNDMLYINYELVFDGGDNPASVYYGIHSYYVSTVFRVVHNELQLIDVEHGWRPLKSGKDVKSFVKEFPL